MEAQINPGRHERRGRHEAGYGWCWTHGRPSPHSNTYCDILFAKYPHHHQSCRISR